MTGFSNDLTKVDVPIASGLTKTYSSTGQPFLLGMHESCYLQNNEHSLLSTNQGREAGTWIDDVMKRHGGTERIVADVETWDGETMDVDLEVQDGLLKFGCVYPTDDEMETLPRVWLTSNEQPWDPSVLDDDSVTIPSCYQANQQVCKEEEPLKEELAQDIQQVMEMDHFAKRVARQNTIVQALWLASGMAAMAGLAVKAMNLVGFKSQKREAKFKEPDFEYYRPKLGWLPMETIKKTFENTTQMYMHIPSFHPFRKHRKSRGPN